MTWGRDLLRLGLVFGALYFFMLGRAPLANPDEGRYAEIPREMVASGDWVTPRLDGVNYFEKPPLMYWAVAVALQVFGPGEGAVRAVPALFGLAGVLLAYAASRRLWGRAAGLGAAFVLGTSALYMAFSHILLLDLAVAVLMSAVLYCFILALQEPPGARRRGLFYGLYASAALATLTKGLIGFLVPGAVMFLWLLALGQWKRLRPFYLPTGGLLFLALAAPWHLLAHARHAGWAHFTSFTSNGSGFRPRPGTTATVPGGTSSPSSCSACSPGWDFWRRPCAPPSAEAGPAGAKMPRPGFSSSGRDSSSSFSANPTRSSSPTSCRCFLRWRR